MKPQNTAHKIVMAAMLASLVCVFTMIIQIPSPLKGYINMGDCIVLLAGWVLSPVYGFLAAGVGSALADLFSGYVVYAPATFVIKGCMALIAYYASVFLFKKGKSICGQIAGGTLAEIWMMFGYFMFEGCLYGFAGSLVNIPANGLQGVAGLVLGVVLMKIFEKHKISFR